MVGHILRPDVEVASPAKQEDSADGPKIAAPEPSMLISTGNEKPYFPFSPRGFANNHKIHCALGLLPSTGDWLGRQRKARGRAFRFGNGPVTLGHRTVTGFAAGAAEE